MPHFRGRLEEEEIRAVLAHLRTVAARVQGTGPPGRALFLRYCASCHGIDGRGNGPVAAALRVRPPDLTRLSERAGGRFPERAVFAAVDGQRRIAAHGSREMPVWGEVFERELAGRAWPGLTALHRTRLLVDYLRSIQRRSAP